AGVAVPDPVFGGLAAGRPGAGLADRGHHTGLPAAPRPVRRHQPDPHAGVLRRLHGRGPRRLGPRLRDGEEGKVEPAVVAGTATLRLPPVDVLRGAAFRLDGHQGPVGGLGQAGAQGDGERGRAFEAVRYAADAQFASGSASRGRRTLSAVPAAATMIVAMASHCSRLSRSPSRATPAIAAMAGSRLNKVLKVRAGSRVSAIISSEYGNAELSTATPNA